MTKGNKMISNSPFYKRLASQKGFSMIEVLVAVGIFSVAVLGLAVGAITITRANKTSEFHTAAANLAQDKLEQLKALNATAFNAVKTACTAYTSTGCSEANPGNGGLFSRTWQVTADSPLAGVNTIDVKVDWRDYTTHTLTVTSAVRLND